MDRLSGTLVLVGFMGAGKTTAARVFAEAEGGEPRDTDSLLEDRFGHSVAEHFERHGEASFRAAEEEVVLSELGAGRPGVLALGGGSVLSGRVREALEAHLVVHLDVPVELAWARVCGAGRPLARDRERFEELYRERFALYESLADAHLPDLPPPRLRAALPHLRALARAPAGTRLEWARSESGDYPVLVGDGLLDSSVWPVRGGRWLISDENVAPRYAGLLEPLAGRLVIEPGEQRKTLATAERAWRWLAVEEASRDDHVVALGGGVVGDLAGFVAAGYQRGIPVVHVPTTLVAQVDSSLGGKTGVDLPEGKNYVGAYHQPAGVLCDPATLRTLPAAEQAAGYAEVLKTALIAGGSLWERVARGEEVDADLIRACIRTKLEIVAADERDAGVRQLLNLGHTVGHAIETATGYRRYRHGEAVALGLLAALRLSEREELREQVRGLLGARGLPVELDPAVDVDAVVRATRRDKKRSAGRVPFVLVREPGDVQAGHPVAEERLREAVAELVAQPAGRA